MKRNDTAGARDYAGDLTNNTRDVDANWWRYFSGYRLKQWQTELDRLTEQSGITLDDICGYLGVTYLKDVIFYKRLPKKKEVYIGVGMALGQSVETISRWISKYGKKRKLYVKDIQEDFAWIYLINAAAADRTTGTNYYRMYDRCAKKALETYRLHWEDHIENSEGTDLLLEELKKVPFDEDFAGLQKFVMEHMDSFQTAFVKPRRMLACYTDLLQAYMPMTGERLKRGSLNALRGYLDDAMVNYVSGDPETIHASNVGGVGHTVRIKRVPKGRRTHISIALALGMTREEIDLYLHLMGFAELDAVDQAEGALINRLQDWEEAHPVQRKLKQRVVDGDLSVELSHEEMFRGVQEMLLLRQDLCAAFDQEGIEFPYINGNV